MQLSLYSVERFQDTCGCVFFIIILDSSASFCCIAVSDIAGRQRLRSARHRQLDLPRHQCSTFSRRAFSVAGPIVWNLLPDQLRDDNEVVLGSHWKHCFSASTIVPSALEVYLYTTMRYINWRCTYLLTSIKLAAKWHDDRTHLSRVFLKRVTPTSCQNTDSGDSESDATPLASTILYCLVTKAYVCVNIFSRIAVEILNFCLFSALTLITLPFYKSVFMNCHNYCVMCGWRQ